MKKSVSTFLIVAAALLGSCGGNSEQAAQQKEAAPSAQVEATPEQEAAMSYDPEGFETPMQAYLALKDALVESDAEMAAIVAARLSELAEGQMVAAAKAVAGTQNIDKQREAFQSLSEMLYEQLKADGTDVTVYKQFCPMAFDNQGAYWLSAEEEILNPYFGDRMLKCGRVDETLAAN